jgi:hypothetical protein
MSAWVDSVLRAELKFLLILRAFLHSLSEIGLCSGSSRFVGPHGEAFSRRAGLRLTVFDLEGQTNPCSLFTHFPAGPLLAFSKQ